MNATQSSADQDADSTAALPVQVERPRDVPDVLDGSIARAAAGEIRSVPRRREAEAAPDPSRELLTEKMLADRWACSVARLQRWRTVGEGPPYLKIVGRVLYLTKDIEAYEEACRVRKAV